MNENISLNPKRKTSKSYIMISSFIKCSLRKGNDYVGA